MVYVNGLGSQPLRRLFGIANGSSESVGSQKIDQARKVVVDARPIIINLLHVLLVWRQEIGDR
jgi:hypothetical protein